MNTDHRQVVAAGCVIALLLAAVPAFAQEAEEDDDLMPAVDTSAMIEEEDAAVDEDVTRTTSGSRVMDSMELSRTEITGNQELPKVLYIVPWKKSNPGDLMGKPVNTLLDEVLAPLDREEFVRQVEYYDDLKGEKETQ